MQSIYTAKNGLQTQQKRLDAVAANIANLGTVAYKSQSTGFKDALYTQMIDPSDADSEANLMQGSGVLLSSTGRDFSQGTPVQTGEPLDFCIEGDGFFTVSDGEDGVLYTRSGAFAVSDEDGGRYLVTSNGYYVLDADGKRIALPEDLSGLSIGENGLMDFGDGTSAKLEIVTFTNMEGLSSEGRGCFAETEASGKAKAIDSNVRNGWLESSNVNITLELTKLIRTQRAYTLSGKVLSAWQEMETETNNIL